MIATLFIIFCLLQIFDVYSTYQILNAGGREVNPMMNWLMDRVGVMAALIGTKVLAVGMLGAAVAYAQEPVAMSALAVLDLYYAVMMYRNYKQMS
jgi:hypothetical protein